MNVALVTPSRSTRSTAGECAWRMLPHLREHCEVDVFVAREHARGDACRAAHELSPKRHDHILYCVADEPECAFMLPLVRELGGIVVQHDWVLADLSRAAHPELERASVRGFAIAAREGGLREARAWLAHARARRSGGTARDGASPAVGLLAFNRSIVRAADAFIVHAQCMKERILVDRNAATPIGVLSHGAERMWSDEPRADVRARLGLPPSWASAFVLASSGSFRAHNLTDRVLEAVASARQAHADVRCLLIGELRPSELDLDELVRRLGLHDAVHVTGRSTDDRVVDWLRACDLAVELREPSFGGVPSAIFRALSAGRAVLTSDVPDHRELPVGCVIRIRTGDDEPSALLRSILSLRDDATRRRALESSARAFVDEHCHWSIVARELASMLESFPPPRSKRKSLVRAMIEASERRVEARDESERHGDTREEPEQRTEATALPSVGPPLA